MDDPVKDALRLTDASYAKLSGEIERNKKTARTEMIVWAFPQKLLTEILRL